ncbi:MAG TPA: type I secretion C-terminal target domain-containing protein [Rhodocyclaceae bacterium]|nr:type I secretion C-terminal target domain-containing protein [Rhodocyclaceae bacterium]
MPAVSIGLDHSAVSDTGSSNIDGITANRLPVLVGSGDANTSLIIKVTDFSGLSASYKVNTDGLGVWRLDLSSATQISGALPSGGLTDGKVRLDVSTTDAAGNSASAASSFVEYLHAPTAPTLTLSTPTVPTLSNGLIRDTWNASVGPYNSGNGVAPTTMEASIDALIAAGTAPNTSTVLTNAAVASVAVGVASETHGLIYLTGGTAYTFQIKGDDSILLEIGGQTVGSVTWGTGSLANGKFTPTTSGWYTLDLYHDNEAGPGNFTVRVSTNGSSFVNLDTTNFQLAQSVQDLNSAGIRTSSLQGSSTTEPNDGYYTVLPYNEGHEAAWIPLSTVAGSLVSPGASDVLNIHITGLAQNTQLTDGTHWATADASGTVDVTGWTMNALSALAPVDYSGTMNAQVQAIATDTLNGVSTTTNKALAIVVDPYVTVAGTTGTGTDDRIVGTSGADTLKGGEGSDLIIGGAGSDTLTGGAGSDVFRWMLADKGTPGLPAQDTITDWSSAAVKNGGDVLDLRDLLQGESHGASGLGNLTSYLHFEKVGTATVVDISSSGGYSAGFKASATDQTIVLSNTDLTSGGTLNDAQIIQDLMTKGKLHTD